MCSVPVNMMAPYAYVLEIIGNTYERGFYQIKGMGGDLPEDNQKLDFNFIWWRVGNHFLAL